jgi:hypothetical protein
MPKWLSSTLIAIGFIALVILAFVPRNVEVNVTNDIHDNEITVNQNGPLHTPPGGEDDGGS